MRSAELFGGITPSDSITDALPSLKDRRQTGLLGIGILRKRVPLK